MDGWLWMDVSISPDLVISYPSTASATLPRGDDQGAGHTGQQQQQADLWRVEVENLQKNHGFSS